MVIEVIELFMGSRFIIKSILKNINAINKPRPAATQRISLNFCPISINLLAPYNWATIGVTAKIIPVKKNQIVLEKAVPTASPARSFALALPAIIVSVVPISA